MQGNIAAEKASLENSYERPSTPDSDQVLTGTVISCLVGSC